jgi:hypothetical protein
MFKLISILLLNKNIYYMKNSEIGLLIGGGLLFAGGSLLLMRKFYSHDLVEPADYRTKTKHNLRKSISVYPNPENPVKFNIPEDYGIGHQRVDQETYHSWGRSDSNGGKRTKRSRKIYKKSKKQKK